MSWKPCCAHGRTAKTGSTVSFFFQRAFLLRCGARLSASTALILQNREMSGKIWRSAVIWCLESLAATADGLPKRVGWGFFFIWGVIEDTRFVKTICTLNSDSTNAHLEKTMYTFGTWPYLTPSRLFAHQNVNAMNVCTKSVNVNLAQTLYADFCTPKIIFWNSMHQVCKFTLCVDFVHIMCILFAYHWVFFKLVLGRRCLEAMEMSYTILHINLKSFRR